ncbi:hypothetical protein B0T12DRAFT_413735 [Alternaria alternata]|jgi:hypothetical protein|nr:hypothetical protein B0T12DRAFT_413735 [Alternaria alternata]
MTQAAFRRAVRRTQLSPRALRLSREHLARFTRHLSPDRPKEVAGVHGLDKAMGQRMATQSHSIAMTTVGVCDREPHGFQCDC